MNRLTINFRVGRGDGPWENYRIEHSMFLPVPEDQTTIGDNDIPIIEKYATFIANTEQAIIRCECEGSDYLIYSPTKWKKK